MMRPASNYLDIQWYERRFYIVSCCLIACAFGPYLVQRVGLRLDHVIIYGFFLYYFCATALYDFHVHGNPALIAMVLVLAAVALWTTVVTVFGEYPRVSPRMALASLDNFLQPFALLGTLVMITQDVRKSALSTSLRYVSITICLFLSLNAIFAACHLFTDTWPVAQYFVGTHDKPTVWENATLQGRYCGIFDQPAENGLSYSVALLAWIYIVNNSRSLWPRILFPVLLLGGILAASKVFLLAGVPGAILYWLFSKKSRSGAYLQTLLGLTVTAVILLLLLDQWAGLSFLSKWMDPGRMDSDFVGLFTAGRFGKEGWIVDRFLEVCRADLLCGFGFGTSTTSFDNGYLEFFWQGGLVGLLLYCVVIAVMLWAGIKGILDDEEHGLLILVLCVIIIGVGFGAPVLTLNRASILLWVFISLAIAIVTTPEQSIHETHAIDKGRPYGFHMRQPTST